MKSGSKLAAFAILSMAVWLSFGGTVFAYDVGDKIEIDYGGTWYPGQVKEINEAQYFVGYDGYGSNWDEWVGSERLRAPEAAAEETAATEEVAAEETAVEEPAEEAPAESAEAADFQEITIRKNGSIWATVAPDGTIRVNGSISGQVEENGNIRVSGMNSGEIDADGTIRKGGMIAGAIDADGTLRANGSIVGSVDADGTLRSNGSIWGEADQNCGNERNRNAVTAVLVFFAGSDFGF